MGPGDSSLLSLLLRSVLGSGQCLDSRGDKQQTALGRKASFDGSFLEGGLESGRPGSPPPNPSGCPQFHLGPPQTRAPPPWDLGPSPPLSRLSPCPDASHLGLPLRPLQGPDPGPTPIPKCPRDPSLPGLRTSGASVSRPRVWWSGEGAREGCAGGDLRV